MRWFFKIQTSSLDPSATLRAQLGESIPEELLDKACLGNGNKQRREIAYWLDALKWD